MAPPRKPPEPGQTSRVYLRLPPDVYERIEAKAKSEGHPFNRILINELTLFPYLDRQARLGELVRDMENVLARYGSRITLTETRRSSEEPRDHAPREAEGRRHGAGQGLAGGDSAGGAGAGSAKDNAAAAERREEAQKKLVKTVETASKESAKEDKKAEAATAAMAKQAEASPPPPAATAGALRAPTYCGRPRRSWRRAPSRLPHAGRNADRSLPRRRHSRSSRRRFCRCGAVRPRRGKDGPRGSP